MPRTRGSSTALIGHDELARCCPVDDQVASLRRNGGTVLRDPADMPWGERVAYVADRDGNPVAVAAAPA